MFELQDYHLKSFEALYNLSAVLTFSVSAGLNFHLRVKKVQIAAQRKHLKFAINLKNKQKVLFFLTINLFFNHSH